MGDHYVPRYYLQGFSLDAKSVWVFDKRDQRRFLTQVKSIANETGFYSPMVESYLANSVEGPANGVLDRIRARAPLSHQDKHALSAYMICMLKRVPRGRERLKELAPSVTKELGDQIDEELRDAARRHPERAALAEQRRHQAREILAEYSTDPPKHLWLANLPPERSPRMLAAIRRMTWRFLVCDRYPAFVTSDNPVFFFSALGVGNPESEVTFPISSNIVLWATWRTDLTEGYFAARESTVMEVNRRTASATTRYAFHATDEDWVLPLLGKSRFRLRMLS